MLSVEERNAVSEVLTPLRIIILSLMLGQGGFAAFVVLLGGERPEETAYLAPIGAAVAVACFLAAIVVPRMIEGQQRKAIVEGNTSLPGQPPTTALSAAGDAGALLMGYQVRRIIAGALLEGPGFFNAFAFMREREPYSLGIVTAMLLGLASLFPIRASVERWLENELGTVRELRQLRG